MIKIKDLKKGDILQSNNWFRKVISIINEDLVALSESWDKDSVKEYIKECSQNYYQSYTDYSLKDYTLVKQDWSWRNLEDGNRYWYLDEHGKKSYDYWDNYIIDQFRVKSGNIYQTEKEAEEAYELIMSKE